jgi:hypothetical protein
LKIKFLCGYNLLLSFQFILPILYSRYFYFLSIIWFTSNWLIIPEIIAILSSGFLSHAFEILSGLRFISVFYVDNGFCGSSI